MATIYEITDGLRSTYRNVPPAGPGVCTICHAQPREGFSVCYSCYATLTAVTHPVRRIVPISLTVKTDKNQLYHSLVHYKIPCLPWEPRARVQQTFRVQLAALFGRFMAQHRACIAGDRGSWNTIVAVPSTRAASAEPHPLHQTLAMLRDVAPLLSAPLRASTAAFEKREASDDRYDVVDVVAGRRVLLVDDTMTTGAHLQSAASALTLAGATVVAAVPIARLINEAYSPDVWKQATRELYDFNACCLEGAQS